MRRRGLVVDLFAGGGGASVGIEAALGRPVDLAINHSATALAVHAANHPQTRHLTADIWEVKPLEATGGAPVDVLWASPDCFPAGTLVLTDAGMKPIENVLAGDMVLTHQGRYRRVTSVMSKVDSTVEVRGYGHHGLVTTANHPFYSKRITKRYPKAGNDGKRPNVQRTLVENPYWPKAADMAGKLWATPKSYPDAAIPTCEGAEFSEDFFYFVGRWVGDGSLNKGDVEICCGNVEAPEFAARMTRQPLRRADGEVVPHRIVDHGSSKLVVWGNAPLGRWLKANFGVGCESKSIPTWCLAMQASWRRALLSGYMDADGYEGVRSEFTSVSKALAVSARLLAVSLGHAAALYMQKGRPGQIEGRTFIARDSYRGAWREDLQYETVMWDGRHLFAPVREVTETGRVEVVFCLSVEEDESFVADGIVVHNCTHFSVAKGDVPRSQNIRSLAWAVCRWVKATAPEWVFLENVREFRGWGPLDESGRPDKKRMGETFKRFQKRLENCGYRVEFRVLDAALYGAPTRRHRLFMVARKNNGPIFWPTPTHGAKVPLRTAAECIDWTIPCPSIFERKKPLAQKTLWRIAQGLDRFVFKNPKPFIVKFRHDSHGSGIEEPMPTVTAGGKERPSRPATGNPLGLVSPHLVKVNHGGAGDRSDRSEDIGAPLSTITATQRGHAVVMPTMVTIDHGSSQRGFSSIEALLPTTTTENRHAVIAPTLVQTGYGEREGQAPRALNIEEPLGTVVAGGSKHALVEAFLARHFTGVVGAPLELPLPTVTAVDHHSLVTATMVEPGQRNDGGQRAADDPLSTIVAKDRHALAAATLLRFNHDDHGIDPNLPLPTVTADSQHIAEVRAFLTVFYGQDRTGGQSLFEPTRTITAKHRLGLVTVNGTEYQIVDIGLRMLSPAELLRAQFGRFAADYDMSAAKTQAAKVRLIGNSVAPEVAEALVRANVPIEMEAVA